MSQMTDAQIGTVTAAIALIGLAILAYFERWWPGIILVVTACVSFIQIIKGRYQSAFIYFAVFMAVYVCERNHVLRHLNMADNESMAIVLVVIALYILFRGFTNRRP